MIAAAQRRIEIRSMQIQFVEGQAESLPFADATFDGITAVTVLCFVRDPKRAIGEMERVLRPGGRLVIAELGRWNLWAAYRRIRGWCGHATWRAATFRTARDLRGLIQAADLDVLQERGAVHYPPWGTAAQLFAPFDLRLGQKSTFGAAFIAISAAKPFDRTTADAYAGLRL
jgi:ubiquinone/menaquinone biosynthesis C-methylase UbiE